MTNEEVIELFEEIHEKVYVEDDTSGILLDGKETDGFVFDGLEDFVTDYHKKIQYKGYTIYFDEWKHCHHDGNCFFKIRVNDERFAVFGWMEESWGPNFNISDISRYKEVEKTITYKTLERIDGN